MDTEELAFLAIILSGNKMKNDNGDLLKDPNFTNLFDPR